MRKGPVSGQDLPARPSSTMPWAARPIRTPRWQASSRSILPTLLTKLPKSMPTVDRPTNPSSGSSRLRSTRPWHHRSQERSVAQNLRHDQRDTALLKK